MVIVPTSLTQNDLLVTYQTVTDLAPARNLNAKLKILVLPTEFIVLLIFTLCVNI
jgi:chromosome partitioning protein